MKKLPKKGVLNYRTVFLSDLHLGTKDSRVEELNLFISKINCRKLVLNGDIIDGWSLKRKGGWKISHTRFFRLILKKIEKESTKVIYTRGNHDDFLATALPLQFGKLRIAEKHIHKTKSGDRLLVVHGDCFDSFSTTHKWVAKIGGIGYENLLRLNRIYNNYRAFMGKEYFSLSKWVKSKVKGAVNHVNRFEEALVNMARENSCNGIVCGHIHVPADRMIKDIRYLNSGDWVESLTAVVEHLDGRLEVIDFPQFLEELKKEKARRRQPKASNPDTVGTSNGRKRRLSGIKRTTNKTIEEKLQLN